MCSRHRILGSGYRLITDRGPIDAERIVNAAGLWADDVAKMVGIDRYTIHPCRGDYFRWRTSRTFSHLVYPVKVRDRRASAFI